MGQECEARERENDGQAPLVSDELAELVRSGDFAVAGRVDDEEGAGKTRPWNKANSVEEGKGVSLESAISI